MEKITVKELSERIMALEANEQILFYDDEEKNDPPIGVIRLDVLESVVILINYIGGGEPCVIDITVYMEGVTNLESTLLSYIAEERMLYCPLFSDQVYVYIDRDID